MFLPYLSKCTLPTYTTLYERLDSFFNFWKFDQTLILAFYWQMSNWTMGVLELQDYIVLQMRRNYNQSELNVFFAYNTSTWSK